MSRHFQNSGEEKRDIFQAEAWYCPDIVGPARRPFLLHLVRLSLRVSQHQSKSESQLQAPVQRKETNLVLSYRNWRVRISALCQF